MKKFRVITKENCSKCIKLKEWLKENNIKFEEWPIEQKWVVDALLTDKIFVKEFCTLDSCSVYTPLIYLIDEGKYYFKEIFGINGLRVEFLKNLLEI